MHESTLQLTCSQSVANSSNNHGHVLHFLYDVGKVELRKAKVSILAWELLCTGCAVQDSSYRPRCMIASQTPSGIRISDEEQAAGV